MNDLFVADDARGGGVRGRAHRSVRRALPRARRDRARLADGVHNQRAQAVYERVGARRDERWLDYSLDVPPGATTPDS